MGAPVGRHGWEIAFQPQLFAAQYDELKAEVRRLKVELDPQSFGQHPRVKLLAAVMAGIKEQIALDPYASRFSLSGPFRCYGRRKGLGLPDRYRLFFRPFEAEGRILLLILWLGFPRKDGDRNDCYAVFQQMMQRGDPPQDWKSLEVEIKALNEIIITSIVIFSGIRPSQININPKPSAHRFTSSPGQQWACIKAQAPLGTIP